MVRRTRTPISALVVLVLAAIVAAGCSTPPVSQATSGPAPTAAPSPTGGPSADPGPGETAEPSEVPTGAPPTGDPAAIPDRPADVTFEEVAREPAGQGTEKVTYRIGWSAPEGVATQFTVVGVTECLRYQKKFDGKPCLVRGMRIPRDAQERITTVAGDLRSVDIDWKVGEIGPPPYSAVLIRASNAAGDSIFTIAWSDTVCFGCVY